MARRGTLRRMFPGGNTSQGFVSYYEYIVPPDTGYTFVLKGGPGTGKSTFMRRIAEEMLALAVDTEYHHCSADPPSVDAVAFPASCVAVVDGTAPHVVEPDHYEVSGEIVDLGAFCDAIPIRRHRSRIEALRHDARQAFARAYRYLAAAGHVRDDWAAVHKARRDEAKLRRRRQRLLQTVFDQAAPPLPEDPAASAQRSGSLWPKGCRRRLFAASITPEGWRHHVDSVIPPGFRTVVVHGEPGTGREELLRSVAEEAVLRGLTVEEYRCPFDPRVIDHVVLPDVGAAVISYVSPRAYMPPAPQLIIDVDGGGDHPGGDETSWDAPALAVARQTFWQLIGRAVDALKDARSAHMALEACYKPYVDFDGIEG